MFEAAVIYFWFMWGIQVIGFASNLTDRRFRSKRVSVLFVTFVLAIWPVMLVQLY